MFWPGATACRRRKRDAPRLPGVPESCLDLVNEYGTCDIQPTCGIANIFPAIAQGLPESRDPELPEEFDDLPAPN